MKPVWWMAGLSVASAGLVSALAPRAVVSAVWLGMAAPLVVVSVSWVAVARTFERNPEGLTAVMMAAFAGKLVLFAAYFGLIIGVLRVSAVPFAESFAAYFIALHMAEAVCMQRMFSERMRAA